jgi:hypothetical protein
MGIGEIYYLGLVAKSEGDVATKDPFQRSACGQCDGSDPLLCSPLPRMDWDAQEDAIGEINNGIARLRGRLSHAAAIS